MFRLLLLALLVFAVYRLIRGRSTRPPVPGPQQRTLPEQHMVRCAHCGVYVPETESIGDEDRRYCSQAHRVAGPVQQRRR
ncbi:hypothetical protein BMS3Bbin12_00293 [bacterium BMS3Bbin12]|nr:hypothetical protein BMS3Abin12_01330 [bacterium BMS3Abin12]GBE47139.1 hypothetical protein BMS3Bbin12_00293 [bacterium BMS3Bbin12]GBE49538.1 hypothetical protein BMS3Bbin13_00457 [bacterium BMS3Bbin13]HDK02740.1 hypothetical protein [Gammaproteobacteria bacterium]